ncbi:MAG: type III secretion system export apparatus subunit SctV [bacterium]
MLAGAVVSMIAMMIIPLPTMLLDALLTVNVATAVTLLMVSLYIPSDPVFGLSTILLLTTLFRLALNVSSTRLILLQADAGEAHRSLGNFSRSGNYVVGGVIFLILTIIQFVVIAKGSERASEVAARFTLDAMPGKQMSIDADLRAGAFDLAEARRRRHLVQQESQLYGAMDGAMKFIKGDAIAGIIITGINIVAGMIVGVAQLGMSAVDAAGTYTLLTIGDGLVSQIPALLISLTAGIIVTRVADDEDSDLGTDIVSQLIAFPKAIAIAAGLMLIFAVIPGLPGVPFLALSVALGLLARGLMRADVAVDVVEEVEKDAETQAQQTRVLFPAVTPVVLALGSDLTSSIPEERLVWLREMVGTMREGVFFETGVKLPGVRIRTDAAAVSQRGFAIEIDEIPIHRAEVPSGKIFVIDPPTSLVALGVEASPTKHPITRRPASWVAASDREKLEQAGHRTWDEAGYLLIVLTGTMKERASEFLGVQEVQALLDQLEGPYPAVVQEVVPKHVSLPLLTEVLRRLVEEGVSIRNLRLILQTLADRCRGEKDVLVLTERVREGLGRAITHTYASQGQVSAYLVDRGIEDVISAAIRQTADGSYLALPPDQSRQIINQVRETVQRDLEVGRTAVLLTDQSVRRYVRRLVATELPAVAVLSFQELDPSQRLQPMGRVVLA